MEKEVAKKIDKKTGERKGMCDPEQALQRQTGPLLHCISNLPLTVAFAAATFTVF